MGYVVPVAGLVLTDALSAACVGVLALLPGLAPAWVLARRLPRADLPTVMVLAFAFTVAASAAGALLAHFLELTLDAGALLSGALLAAAAALSWRYRDTGERPGPGRPGLVLGAATAVLATIEGTYLLFTADVFYHMAAARSLIAADRPLVTDPFHGTASQVLDPTSGAWHTLVAQWSRLSGLDVAFLTPGFGIVGAVVVVLATWVLLKAVSGSETVATWTAAAWVLASWLLDFRLFVLPNRVSLALVYLCLAMLVALARRPGWPILAVVATAGFGAATTHLASAQVLYLALGLTVLLLVMEGLTTLARRRRPDWRPARAATIALVVMVVAALPVVLPRAGTAGEALTGGTLPEKFAERVWHLPYGMTIVKPGEYVAGGAVPMLLGSALAAVMLYAAFRDRDRASVTAGGLAALPALTLLDPPVTTALIAYSPYMVTRIGAMVRFAPYVAAAWGIARPRRTVSFWLGAATLASLCVLSLPAVASTFAPTGFERKGEGYPVTVSRVRDVRHIWGRKAIAEAREVAGSGYPRVAGDPETTYYLAGMAPFSVVAALPSHSPVAIEGQSGKVRRDDMAYLLEPGLTSDERREVLERWGAGYVALWTMRAPEKAAFEEMRVQDDLFEPVVTSTDLVMLRVLP